MAATDVVARNENIHNNSYHPRKDVSELSDKDDHNSKYSLDDPSVHLVFTGSKKTIPSFEVNLQPDKIVEVYRLPVRE